MSDTYHPTLIRDMPVQERPRERLERLGPSALNVADLLAIILRVGNQGVSAVQLGQQLVCHFGGLRGIAEASVQELSQVDGIGPAKACQIQSAFELGKRLASLPNTPRAIISSPGDAANLVMETLRYYREEHFHILLLDTRNQVICARDISIGTLNASLVHPREVFKMAMRHSAHAIIVAHNHPSGDPSPSQEDLSLTARLKEAGILLGIGVLDHLIIGNGVYVSLKERGLL